MFKFIKYIKKECKVKNLQRFYGFPKPTRGMSSIVKMVEVNTSVQSPRLGNNMQLLRPENIPVLNPDRVVSETNALCLRVLNSSNEISNILAETRGQNANLISEVIATQPREVQRLNTLVNEIRSINSNLSQRENNNSNVNANNGSNVSTTPEETFEPGTFFNVSPAHRLDVQGWINARNAVRANLSNVDQELTNTIVNTQRARTHFQNAQIEIQASNDALAAARNGWLYNVFQTIVTLMNEHPYIAAGAIFTGVMFAINRMFVGTTTPSNQQQAITIVNHAAPVPQSTTIPTNNNLEFPVSRATGTQINPDPDNILDVFIYMGLYGSNKMRASVEYFKIMKRSMFQQKKS